MGKRSFPLECLFSGAMSVSVREGIHQPIYLSSVWGLGITQEKKKKNNNNNNKNNNNNNNNNKQQRQEQENQPRPSGGFHVSVCICLALLGHPIWLMFFNLVATTNLIIIIIIIIIISISCAGRNKNKSKQNQHNLHKWPWSHQFAEAKRQDQFKDLPSVFRQNLVGLSLPPKKWSERKTIRLPIGCRSLFRVKLQGGYTMGYLLILFTTSVEIGEELMLFRLVVTDNVWLFLLIP